MPESPQLFDGQLIGAALRAVAALAGLIALGTFAIWFQRRQRGGVRRIRVSDRLLLTRGSSILLLDVEGRRMLIGVTPEAIRLITPLEGSFESTLKSLEGEVEEKVAATPLPALLRRWTRRPGQEVRS